MDQKTSTPTLYCGHVPLAQVRLSRGEFLQVLSRDIEPPNAYGDLTPIRLLDEFAAISLRGDFSHLIQERS